MSSRFPIGVPTTNNRPNGLGAETSGLIGIIFGGIGSVDSRIILMFNSRAYQLNCDEAIEVIAQAPRTSVLTAIIRAGIMSANF